jgi:ABC-type Fe3+/spermidine/putrescine transport system ATPase subunit
MSSLVLHAVSRKFRTAEAVRSASLEITSGELFAILGPSGSGKTTLLRMIAGFERPDAGSISMEGRDITAVPPQHRGIGMVFQNYALFPHLTVYENVAFPLRAHRVGNPELADRVQAALEGVRLRGKSADAVTALSGGEQQRVAIARALVLRPKLLLFDEPLSSLDVALRLQMREEIRALQQRLGITTLYVTHDQAEAMALADRIGVMREGMIEQVGTPREVYEHPVSPFIASFVGGATLLRGTYDPERQIFKKGNLAVRIVSPRKRCTAGNATLAVRPDAIRVAEMNEQSFVGELLSTEYRGYTIAFRIRLDGIELHCVAPGFQSLPAPGNRISFVIDPNACALFGEETN